MYTFKKIKEHLQSQPAICFRGLTKDDVGGLSTFLENFLEYNKTYDTIYKNGHLQTKKGSRRSIGDLYRIAYYYFPHIKLTTIYKAVLRLIINKKALSAICQATGLRVYRATKSGDVPYFNGEGIDEFYTDFSHFEEFKECKSKSGYWGDTYGKNEINFINLL